MKIDYYSTDQLISMSNLLEAIIGERESYDLIPVFRLMSIQVSIELELDERFEEMQKEEYE